MVGMLSPKIEAEQTGILDLNRLYKCPNDSYMEWKEQAWNNGQFVWGSDCDIVGSNIRKVGLSACLHKIQLNKTS